MRETGEPRGPRAGAEVEVGRGPGRAIPPSPGPGGISPPHQPGQKAPPPPFVHSRPLSAQARPSLPPPASSPEPGRVSAADLGAQRRLHPRTLEGAEGLRFFTRENLPGAHFPAHRREGGDGACKRPVRLPAARSRLEDCGQGTALVSRPPCVCTPPFLIVKPTHVHMKSSPEDQEGKSHTEYSSTFHLS
ncbi:formin-like protein 7 isoform X2 [Leptonychotes weddellii]|uniref:Formin-like protein 7 isoform X2 n=1 Tax=Leptonychotes weddellii TaxID=9713 RepID=A0A7F8Q5T7_LEPWE|nr:formin-like protein 7 isoform X2 [Leptonychotes weddellii]